MEYEGPRLLKKVPPISFDRITGYIYRILVKNYTNYKNPVILSNNKKWNVFFIQKQLVFNTLGEAPFEKPPQARFSGP